VKLKYIAITCAFFLPISIFGQKDGPTPVEECRFIKSADLVDSKAPNYRDYPSQGQAEVRNAKLDLTSNPIAKTYRTVLRLAMAEGPNFAGHYRVAIWGCGSSCAMFAVINLKTGRVMTAKDLAYVSTVRLATDDDGGGILFKANSALLVVMGDPEEDESRAGAYYFVLQNEHLKLIHKTRVIKNCPSH
jgi:hypothetical protein